MTKRPSIVVELFEPKTWRAEVAAATQELIPGEVLDRLKRTPGETMYEDTMEYLETAYRKSGKDYDVSTLTETVLTRFTHFRGFHGCRPLSFDSYRQDGLVALTRQQLARYAHQIFDGSIPLAELEMIAKQADLDTRLDRIHFCADADFLIQHCGHYLIYGGEALNCLWKSGESRDQARFYESQRRCREKGIPTVFVCDVPIDWIVDCYRRELGRTLLTRHLQLASDTPVNTRDWSRNCGYAIARNLPAIHIKSHFHPERIRDPLRSSVDYCTTETRCEWCG